MKAVKLPYVSIFLLPFLFIVPVIFALVVKPLSLFPWDKRVFNVDAYADGDGMPSKRGSSVDSFETGADAITMKYTLRDAEEYPYAGVYFSLVANGDYTNLSGYDRMKIVMSVTVPDVYQVKITTPIEGYTNEDDSNTYCPLEKTVFMNDNMGEYVIRLSEFEFLDWWFDDAGLEPEQYGLRKQLEKVYQINLQQTKPVDRGTELMGGFRIKSVSLHRSFATLYAASGAGFVSTCIACVIVFLRLRKRVAKDAVPAGKFVPVELDSYAEKDTKRLSEIIESGYTNPDLSVAMLYRETGISRQRIALLVRKKYKMPLKRLVNAIRLKEAARLLAETDRNITDIAMALGFGGPSYFFQVFKGGYRMSPSDYRKKYAKRS